MTLMTPPPLDQQGDDEMLVPHTDFADRPQPMEVAQAETATAADSQSVDDPPSARFTWIATTYMGWAGLGQYENQVEKYHSALARNNIIEGRTGLLIRIKECVVGFMRVKKWDSQPMLHANGSSSRAMNWVQRKIYLYNVTFGLFMLDWWERYLFNILVIVLMWFVFYNGSRYVTEFCKRHLG